jgi:hypothetical protein
MTDSMERFPRGQSKRCIWEVGSLLEQSRRLFMVVHVTESSSGSASIRRIAARIAVGSRVVGERVHVDYRAPWLSTSVLVTASFG